METLDILKILEFLPHRYPFLLVDRVLKCESEHALLAIKNVTINEPFFTGHFPLKPVMPGVLIIEALAQAAAILAYYSTDWDPAESIFYLGSIDNAKFKRVVSPGDQLQLEIEVLRKRSRAWKFRGIATVDNELVCQTDITSVEGKIEK